MGLVELPHSWGCDTSTKLTVASAQRLSAAQFHGQEIRFVFRYVPLPGNNPEGDIDAAELEAIQDAGLVLLLVQHCRAGSWAASGAQGALDGAQAGRSAAAAGYATGAMVALDLESLATVGQPVIDHCEAWSSALADAGFRPLLYVGFDCGLTPQQLYDLHGFDRYWSDAGLRNVAKRQFCCKQYAQTVIAGISVDPDHAFPDLLGGCLVGMARDEPPTRPDLATETAPQSPGDARGR